MELESQSESLSLTIASQEIFKKHWSFHLVIVLSLLQVIGHFVAVHHLIILKPLPIIILLIITQKSTKEQKLFFYGLLMSLLGDILLMINDDLAFQAGTFCFLIAHVLYIRAFISDISEKKLRKLRKKRHIALLAFISFIVTLLIFNVNELWNKTPLLPLFLLYGVVLSGMAIAACLRSNTDASYLLILIGALLFGVSDNTLAYFKFNKIQS